MLHQKCGRASEFTAGRKSLHQTGGENNDGRKDADGFVGRHESDRHRADRHQHDGNHQRRLAAVTVGIGSKDDATGGANEERQSERTEGQKQRRRWIVIGEKCLGNHGEIAVDGDVILLQRVSDRGRDDQPGNAFLFRTCLRHPRQLDRGRYRHSKSLSFFFRRFRSPCPHGVL